MKPNSLKLKAKTLSWWQVTGETSTREDFDKNTNQKSRPALDTYYMSTAQHRLEDGVRTTISQEILFEALIPCQTVEEIDNCELLMRAMDRIYMHYNYTINKKISTPNTISIT